MNSGAAMSVLLDLKWMLLPFLACLILSINHVYLGIHVIARRVIFVDLALAQIAALGATFALTLGYDPATDSLRISLFSLSFTFVGAVAFAIARMRRERVPQEAFIGIIYAAASAAAILILSKSPTGGEELKHMLVGDVLLVTGQEIWNMTLLYGAIGLFHLIFRRKFLAISIAPGDAIGAHINVRLWDILFYMSFGVVITKSVAIVGVLLVFSYLVVPAVLAQMWAETIRGRLLLGWLAAILASTLGIAWSFYADYPTGPAIVVMLGLFLVVSSVVYYIRHAPEKLRAVAAVAALAVFFSAFVFGLAYFKKSAPAVAASRVGPVDVILQDLASDEESHQLHVLGHLGEVRDPRIVPALASLLSRTRSDQVQEEVVNALGAQRDPQAIPVLRRAAEGNWDEFMMLAIAGVQLKLGDAEGFATLIKVLKIEGATYARQQASELLEKTSGRTFGYKVDLPVSQNAAALRAIEEWYRKEGAALKHDAATGRFIR
jgi:zinc/manganese transport system permease protein